MIYGYCFTNLDAGKRHKWPELFCAVPRVGERVQAESDGACSDLRVVAVTYKMIPDPNDWPSDGSPREKIPGIIVELNK